MFHHGRNDINLQSLFDDVLRGDDFLAVGM